MKKDFDANAYPLNNSFYDEGYRAGQLADSVWWSVRWKKLRDIGAITKNSGNDPEINELIEELGIEVYEMK